MKKLILTIALLAALLAPMTSHASGSPRIIGSTVKTVASLGLACDYWIAGVDKKPIHAYDLDVGRCPTNGAISSFRGWYVGGTFVQRGRTYSWNRQ